MYSPYLFARRFELLALRDMLENEPPANLKNFLPVLEPVKASTTDLLRCMSAYSKKQAALVVITNPAKHEFSSKPAARKALRDCCNPLFEKSSVLIPGYLVRANMTITRLRNFLAKHKDRKVALIYDSPSFSNSELNEVAGSPNVLHHIVVQESLTKAQRASFAANKYIDTRDHFRRLPRNSDYNGQEFFTDRSLSSARIGDYAVLGRSLEIGGGRPGAVVIHATYKHPNTGAIWVEHFVSDDIDRDVGTPEAKFLQAARKLVKALAKRPAEFGSNWALDSYKHHVAKNTSPGLGKNKQYQLMHHMHLMLNSGKSP